MQVNATCRRKYILAYYSKNIYCIMEIPRLSAPSRGSEQMINGELGRAMHTIVSAEKLDTVINDVNPCNLLLIFPYQGPGLGCTYSSVDT